MKTIRVVALENEPSWQSLLADYAKRMGAIEIDFAATVSDAWKLFVSDVYDFVTIDLSMVADVSPTAFEDQGGFDLLDRLRRLPRGTNAALLIITAYPTTERVRQAFAKYDVDDFLIKGEFDESQFAASLRRALFRSRVRAAAHCRRQRSRLTISTVGSRFVSADLSGPIRNGSRILNGNGAFAAEEFAEKADALNVSILKRQPGAWRSFARSIGESLYRDLTASAEIAELLIRSVDLSTTENPLAIQFSGSSVALRVPFELMTDGNDYLSLVHMMSRRIAALGIPPTRHGEPFDELVQALARSAEPLRILLVAANSDGRIPMVHEEVDILAHEISNSLEMIGLEHVITELSGSDATYDALRDRLRNGQVHILHYAGHGRFDDELPEVSGLVLGSGKNAAPLTAAALKQLVEDTELRLVFLSCCVGARTSQQVGRGDFHGTIDAITRGGVPTTLGFRWIVPDQHACRFARTFYEEFLQTFSTGVALLRARRAATDNSILGRDNSTWASPILVEQAG